MKTLNWKVKKDENPKAKGQFLYSVINSETNGIIANVSDGETLETRKVFDNSLIQSNAKLIASAPELLKGLKLAKEILMNNRTASMNEYKEIALIIFKAEN